MADKMEEAVMLPERSAEGVNCVCVYGRGAENLTWNLMSEHQAWGKLLEGQVPSCDVFPNESPHSVQ